MFSMDIYKTETHRKRKELEACISQAKKLTKIDKDPGSSTRFSFGERDLSTVFIT